MNRLFSICILTLMTVFACNSKTEVSKSEPPNVIIILVDDFKAFCIYWCRDF